MQTASPLIELLGDKLLSKAVDGAGASSVSTADALKDKKAIGLYFSAHWCPPCRGFTPKLAEFYTADLKAKGLEIVFVSSDKSETEFASYFGEQPWLALPFEDRARKAALSKKYKVQGIPTFVVIDAQTGETITTDGREAVMEDPKGAQFPWKPPSFWDALGDEFLSGTDGETVGLEALEGKTIGLYFSAHWCPPCRGFTPDLIEAYKKYLKDKNLEIIFVSSDRDQKSFLEYYGEMPWLAIPNGDKRKGMLSKRFGVQGIPSFVLVDGKTGETITTNARGNVSSDPEGKEFPWFPKALVNMTTDGPEGINEELSLCVMLEGCDEKTTAQAQAVLEKIAEASKAAKEDTLFFFAPAVGQITGRIRELTNLGKPTDKPVMALLDIPDDGGYYVSPATEITEETVSGFLAAYKAKALERKQLG